MTDIFKSIEKIRNNIIKLKKSIKKINYKLENIDLSKPNADDFEKIADYFDDIKCISNRSMIKIDHIVDMENDSSDLSSLSDISLNYNELESLEKNSSDDSDSELSIE